MSTSGDFASQFFAGSISNLSTLVLAAASL
jgi:hypothetical protein